MFNGMNGLEILKNWPRYEYGEPVRIGDDFEDLGQVAGVKFGAGGVTIEGTAGNSDLFITSGERVKRPENPVLAADGEPLEVGQTVWDTDAETDTPLTVVEVSSDLVRCEYTWKDGKTYRPCYPPDQLTHTKPEIDSWERLEDDAMLSPHSYICACGKHDDAMPKSVQMSIDLVRRARALADRERGE